MKNLMTTFAIGALALTTFSNAQFDPASFKVNEQVAKKIIEREEKRAKEYEVVSNLTEEKQYSLHNPRIDAEAYVLETMDAVKHRESRRVSEQKFIEMSQQEDTIILDTRSRRAFDLVHVEGAINLPFPDISYATLDAILPDKSKTILIYCNNNFASTEVDFLSKSAPMSLNVPTYTQLYSYGYRNVYELETFLTKENTKIKLAGAGILDPELLKSDPNIYAMDSYEYKNHLNGQPIINEFRAKLIPNISTEVQNTNTTEE